jgi:ribulose-5-phosphate 4-epimerase/fuculose-1-phosphate aldolase
MDELPFPADAACPPGMPLDEWRARVGLAACYRLFDALGWTEGIYNHITLRVAGVDETPAFLINPYGLHYAEVTPANLVKVDVQGRVLQDTAHPVNAAGMVIHCAVHAARPDVHCVMHTHTTAVMAVACKEAGLRGDNFYSAQLLARVACHDFEGVTTRADEGPRLVSSLGARPILLLRNHGVLVAGGSLCEAFSLLWQMQRACEVQCVSDGMAGPNRPVAPAVLAEIGQHLAPMRTGGSRPGELLFKGLLRRAGIDLARVLEPGC